MPVASRRVSSPCLSSHERFDQSRATRSRVARGCAVHTFPPFSQWRTIGAKYFSNERVRCSNFNLKSRLHRGLRREIAGRRYARLDTIAPCQVEFLHLTLFHNSAVNFIFPFFLSFFFFFYFFYRQYSIRPTARGLSLFVPVATNLSSYVCDRAVTAPL